MHSNGIFYTTEEQEIIAWMDPKMLSMSRAGSRACARVLKSLSLYNNMERAMGDHCRGFAEARFH